MSVAAVRAQQECALTVRGATAGVTVRGPAPFAARGPVVNALLPAGAWRVTFAAGAVLPAPLDLTAAPGDRVAISVGQGDALGGEPTDPTTVRGGRVFERPRERGVRVRARVPAAAAEPFGLTVRWHDADNCYRLLLDPAGEVRLERRVAGHELVLQRTVLSGRGLAARTLELQVDGFRLTGLVDDEPLLHAFDGALTDGGCGTIAAPGSAIEFTEVVVAAPAPPAATVGVVAGRGRAEIVACSPGDVAAVYAVVLRLDRPTIRWPTDGLGFEVPLLLRLAEPVVLAGGCGVGIVGDDGRIAGGFRWPDAPALRLQSVLATVLIGSPDGSELRARLPSCAIVL